MLAALQALSEHLQTPTKLLMGGGGCMVLAYGFPMATNDIDAVIYKSETTLQDIAPFVLKIASEQNLPKDWLNPYFETFLFSLPKDYESRLVNILHKNQLQVNGLGAEDLLILKCFAGRDKDIPHARALLKRQLNLDLVYQHIYSLIEKNIPNAKKALDFLDDLTDEG